MKYPIGMQSFDQIIEDGYVYIDKTDLVCQLTHEGNVYNPFILLNALNNQSVDDYWFRSGTPTYLIRLLTHFNENPNELTGKHYRPEEFIDYKADVEQRFSQTDTSPLKTTTGISIPSCSTFQTTR